MEDQTTIQPAGLPSGTEREYMIRTAREGLQKWETWLAGGYPLDAADLTCCTRGLLEILEAGE